MKKKSTQQCASVASIKVEYMTGKAKTRLLKCVHLTFYNGCRYLNGCLGNNINDKDLYRRSSLPNAVL